MGFPEGVACLPPSPHCHGAVLLTNEKKGWVILDINKKMATINSTKDEHKIKEKQKKRKRLVHFVLFLTGTFPQCTPFPQSLCPPKYSMTQGSIE